MVDVVEVTVEEELELVELDEVEVLEDELLVVVVDVIELLVVDVGSLWYTNKLLISQNACSNASWFAWT